MKERVKFVGALLHMDNYVRTCVIRRSVKGTASRMIIRLDQRPRSKDQVPMTKD